MKQIMMVLVLCIASCTNVDTDTFESDWSSQNDRIWVGEDYWANPLKDWRVENGRLECINEQGGRNLQLITYQVGDVGKELKTEVFIGSLNDKKRQAGIKIGLKDSRNEYRYNCFFGKGLQFGIDQKNNRLFCFDEVQSKNIAETEINIEGEGSYHLELNVKSSEDGSTAVLYLKNADKSKLFGKLEIAGLKNEQFTGNIALFSSGKSWFDAWKVKGDRLIHFPKQKWGPILWSQYTLSRGTLNLLGLMAPIGERDSQQVAFQVKKEKEWVTIKSQTIEPLSRTALFEFQDWEDDQDHDFRLAYEINEEMVYWEGVIRKDPKEKSELSVAGFTGHKSYNFPNTEVVSNVSKHNPDLLFFSGDQIYEDNGGFGVIRKDVEKATLSYLSKYYMFGWSFGDLMRDRPSVILPDDHDVFYGNIWGDSGDGYFMPVDWVNMVQRTQTGHFPKAFDPTPLKNDIGVYYTDLIYGRISFAILEDRKFKTQPTKIPKKVRHSEKRPDWVTVAGFDPEKVNDKSYSLLGERQLDFLEHWSSDWKDADMKISLSQTTFAGIATHHGSELNTLIADYDANGWPQHGRDNALEKLRKGFAFMFAGDTHLPTIVKHGVDNWDDAGWAFCVPSITAGYPRAWNPGFKGGNHQVGMPDYTGEYKDGFGNKITIWAAANPEIWMAHPQALKKAGDLELFKMKRSGYGIIRLAKEKGTIKMESYSLEKGPGEGQMEGWPKVVNMLENDGRTAIEYLPELQIKGLSNPVLQVLNTADNEIVYTLRLKENNFIPNVYKKGSYSIKIGDPDVDVWQEFKNVKSSKSKGANKLNVVFE